MEPADPSTRVRILVVSFFITIAHASTLSLFESARCSFINLFVVHRQYQIPQSISTMLTSTSRIAVSRVMARSYSATASANAKVAVLGAAGGIGQPLSLLLKLSPEVDELSCYDIVGTPGVAADLSHVRISMLLPLSLYYIPVINRRAEGGSSSLTHPHSCRLYRSPPLPKLLEVSLPPDLGLHAPTMAFAKP
jgi:hypothetical protein